MPDLNADTQVSLTAIETSDPMVVMFWDAALTAGMHCICRGYKSSPALLDSRVVEFLYGLAPVAWQAESKYGRTLVLEGAASFIYISGPCKEGVESSKDWKWNIASRTIEEARRLSALINEFLPPDRPADQSLVPIGFWTLSKNGPSVSKRNISAPSWAEVSANYPGKTGSLLSSLMPVRPPIEAGQLILFHGKPGTGKTYAIRSLIREWRPWCRVSYIVDPERFFGDAHYMLDVLLHQDDDDEEEAVAKEEGRRPLKRWHLILAEDSDEFLTIDAKTRTGQALSRLLNLTEGIIGQGLQVLTLLTANESVEKLHPAVSRTGRCMANVLFDPFGEADARKWLAKRGTVEPNHGLAGLHLSDLYSLARHGGK